MNGVTSSSMQPSCLPICADTPACRNPIAEAVSTLLDPFYDECASAIWEHDGILNKTMGDGSDRRIQFSDQP